MKSNFLNLNWADFGKGALIAVLTAVFATALSLLQAGTLFDKASLTLIGSAALTAFLEPKKRTVLWVAPFWV